ncbi:MAG TPA: hypothetical protein VFN35_07480 [Ktedonobacteraceae bacterium]|nr:hypothetical protein [Ktedonobacteraceae bacterium]
MKSRDASLASKKHQSKALMCLYAQRDEPLYRVAAIPGAVAETQANGLG